MTSDYKKYSLNKLQEWVHDAMNSDASPHEIYSAIREAVREDYYYHKDCMSRRTGLLELLSGHRPVKDNSVLQCDRDDPSPECQKSWNDFWEENYYPEEYSTNKTNLDVEIEEIREAGGYEWTPNPDVSRNDPNRLKFEDGWIYESPDGGKTVTKRKPTSLEKVIVKESNPKKWMLPVEEDPSGEYFVTFPDDLLEVANLKENDMIEWVDQGDGSYLLKKYTERYRF
jgi:hypothetical protein